MTDKPTPSAALQQSTAFEGNPAQTTSFFPVVSPQFSTTPTKEGKEVRPPPITTPMAVESKKPLAISNLMSPPELPPFDSFAQGVAYSPTRAALSEQRTIPHPPLSPPISPFAKPTNTIDPAPTQSVVAKDPILYPGSDVASSPPEPLFSPSEEQLETRRAVDEHITSRPATLFREATPPRREHYELALYFKSAVMQKFRENPGGWLRKERELLARDRKNGFTRAKFPTILPAVPVKTQAIKPPASRNTNPNKIRKPRPHTPTGPTNGARPIRATPAGPARQPAIRHTIRVSSTPEPRMRTVAPNREDKDFNSLENYCPPLSSLPNKPNSLKVDWKGNALDLSHDPYAHLLHPDELLLAAGLRLDCATYLTSKRRIFIRRLECARIGKEFRKTDAQQACKIDVNKASKLWTAYDKVGWLDIQWMRPYL